MTLEQGVKKEDPLEHFSEVGRNVAVVGTDFYISYSKGTIDAICAFDILERENAVLIIPRMVSEYWERMHQRGDRYGNNSMASPSEIFGKGTEVEMPDDEVLKGEIDSAFLAARVGEGKLSWSEVRMPYSAVNIGQRDRAIVEAVTYLQPNSQEVYVFTSISEIINTIRVLQKWNGYTNVHALSSRDLLEMDLHRYVDASGNRLELLLTDETFARAKETANPDSYILVSQNHPTTSLVRCDLGIEILETRSPNIPLPDGCYLMPIVEVDERRYREKSFSGKERPGFRNYFVRGKESGIKEVIGMKYSLTGAPKASVHVNWSYISASHLSMEGCNLLSERRRQLGMLSKVL